MDKETIFAEALKIDSTEDRSRFLDEACVGNTQLREDIEHLLAAHNDAGSFLNQPPEELELTTGSNWDINKGESDDAWRELLDPSDNPDCLGTLGPYEVIEFVGRGGMGVVLRAHDLKLNRTVAVKLLAPELSANAMAVRRFLREAQAAAAVSHDHVVTIHAIDEKARPPIIVMEYVDGQSLQQKIDMTGALDVKSILRIGMQTASGLTAAHRQGLVHRDIKPSNILLENGIERVKLTDFGLARAVDDIGMTRTGHITGTPQYMSPEQAQGHSFDHRTDLFSLGCVLYAMCTGRAAFRADSAVAVMHRIVNDVPRPIRELNEDIPEWLSEITCKLLAKNPGDRFESAEEVSDLLGRHLAHLQQPESVPQPERVAPTENPATELGEKIIDTLSMMVRVGIITFITIWIVGGIILSLMGHWRAVLFESSLLLGTVIFAWIVACLVDRSSKREQGESSRPEHTAVPDKRITQNWFWRIPIPAWISVLLFGVVYVSALVEWTGLGHELGSRPNGIGFYLLATVFVIAWGFCSVATRLIRGHRTNEPSLPPRRSHLAGFFTAAILLTGAFVWQWTELNKESERQRMLGFFIGHGSITLRLPTSDIKVDFNGKSIKVPSDGVVVLRPDWPGSFIYEIQREDGSVGQGEFLIHGGMNAEVKTGVFNGARSVTVDGPVRGKINNKSDADNRKSNAAAKPPLKDGQNLNTTKDSNRSTTTSIQDNSNKEQSDQQIIQGSWNSVSVTNSGVRLTQDKFTGRSMAFFGDRFTGPKRHQLLPGKFVLDEATNPKQIDLHFPAEENTFLVIKGIYRLDHDILTIFMQADHTATKRPTDFTPTPDDKRSLIVLQRIHDRDLLQGMWRVVALESAGQVAPDSSFEEKRFLIERDQFSRTGKPEDLRMFRLDSTTTPKTIDIPGSVEKQFTKGIYKFQGDTLKLCFSQSMKLKRPTVFETEGTNYFYFTLKKMND